MSKLLYIANVRMPTEKAHGLQIMKTCEALADKNVQVKLAVPKRLNHLKDDPFNFYNVPRSFSIEKLNCLDWINLPFFKKIFFWLESFTFYLSVNKFLKNNKFDVYYTRDLLFALWLSKKNKSVFYELHSLPDILEAKYKNAFRQCRGLVVISEGIKQDLLKIGVPENKILISRDAVDVEKFQVQESQEQSRARLGLPLNKEIILYAGHLYEWKGARLLASVSKNLPEVEFYLVGGTKEDVAVFKNEFNFSNLHVIGWQKHENMPYWLNAADILILPNSIKEKISSHYTSPMKLFEYMAAKKPIVASDLPSLREILAEDNAIFFKSDNISALADSIKKILNDNVLAEKISANAYRKVEEFTWKNRAQKIVDFIF